MAFNPGQDEDDFGVLAELNVIPLVDVMLVLLIMMMVTSPFLEQGVDVNLPVTEGKSLQKNVKTDEPLVLFVSKDQNLRLGKDPVTRANLERQLMNILRSRQDKEIFVRADREVPYGVVAEIMSQVQSAGVTRVGLVTQPQ